MATVNILKDATVTLTAGGDDDGAYTAGSSDTLKCDTVSYTAARRVEDHGTAQDEIEQNRTVKEAFDVTIETKLADATSLAILQGNEVVNVAVTAGTGFGFSCPMIVESVEVNYAGPSTLRASFKAYGVAPTFS